MDYKKIANELLDMLIELLEQDYELLNKHSGINPENARAEWVDEQIIKYTHITSEQLDALLHGEEINGTDN